MTIDQVKIDKLVDQWLAIDVNEITRNEILQLQKDKNYDILNRKLSTRIAFGTAGLRSSMESGFAHMNDVTILQASQGLIDYLLEQNGDSIVVGYDHRFHSQRFAEITASVALTRGFTVYYLGNVEILSEESDLANFDKDADRLYVHTPMVPFGIDHFGASGGVMVTASHNPAKDNGYKVYYGNGCQIIPPHDLGIAAKIEQNLVPWSKLVWEVKQNFARGIESGKLKSVKGELTEWYAEVVASKLIENSEISYGFVYTPMHGVGLEIFEKLASKFNIQIDSVPEQAAPNPDFPTVKFPNPEEAGALDLAIERAKAKGVKLVVASDPDADRFSVAVETRGKQWKQLTGNEIGILFAVYVIEELTSPEDLANTYLINSTVSSQLLKSIAEKSGCKYTDTLTGFKWIGNKAIDLKREGFHVPFGYEEAIGYMFNVANDKDGISAAVVWLQLYEKWFSSGEVDPVEKLEQIYAKYGWYKECNGYYKLDDVSKTPKIFNETIRSSYGEGRQFPASIGKFDVVEWRDLTVGYESLTADHIPVLPVDPTSQMITAVLKPSGDASETEKVRFTCRGSGTEPKLKVYIEGSSGMSERHAQSLATECWGTLREEWFRPEENGLQEVV